MKNCCLNAAERSGASRRANWSELPPAAKGATIFTGFIGHSCAEAGEKRATPNRAERPMIDSNRLAIGDRNVIVVLVSSGMRDGTTNGTPNGQVWSPAF